MHQKKWNQFEKAGTQEKKSPTKPKQTTKSKRQSNMIYIQNK